MGKKLASWKGSILSIGGHLTLLKASLSSFSLYYISLFPILRGVIKKIVKLQRKFLWCRTQGQKSLAPITWETIILPKTLVGLSVGNLLHINLSWLFKWVWGLLSDQDSLWSRIVKQKYSYGTVFVAKDLFTPAHGGPWRGICATILKHQHTRSFPLAKIRKRVGNGTNTFFWYDTWVGDAPLKCVCPRLFILSTDQQSTVASNGFWDGLFWRWCPTLRRSLRPRDTVKHQHLR